MTLQPVPRTTLVRQVAQAIEEAADAEVRAGGAARSLALMYAEAIDDADEADAVLRFGAKLRACLDALGLELPTRPGERPVGGSVPAPPASLAA